MKGLVSQPRRTLFPPWICLKYDLSEALKENSQKKTHKLHYLLRKMSQVTPTPPTLSSLLYSISRLHFLNYYISSGLCIYASSSQSKSDSLHNTIWRKMPRFQVVKHHDLKNKLSFSCCSQRSGIFNNSLHVLYLVSCQSFSRRTSERSDANFLFEIVT